MTGNRRDGKVRLFMDSPIEGRLIQITAASGFSWFASCVACPEAGSGRRDATMEVGMAFHIFQCEREKDCFVVTDAEHESAIGDEICPYPNDKLVKVGVFGELGENRIAFDEGLAKRSIAKQGFYRFTAKSFDPVAERPLAMP